MKGYGSQMEEKLIKKILFIVAVMVAIFGSASWIISSTVKSCVTVLVDFGSLKNNDYSNQCVETNSRINALTLIQKSGFRLDGTDKYGLQVVCRVDGLPTPDMEKCAVMPPENAYWAVVVSRRQDILNFMPKWGWAKTGISEVYLNPGDSIGLIYTKDGKIRWPN